MGSPPLHDVIVLRVRGIIVEGFRRWRKGVVDERFVRLLAVTNDSLPLVESLAFLDVPQVLHHDALLSLYAQSARARFADLPRPLGRRLRERLRALAHFAYSDAALVLVSAKFALPLSLTGARRVLRSRGDFLGGPRTVSTNGVSMPWRRYLGVRVGRTGEPRSGTSLSGYATLESRYLEKIGKSLAGVAVLRCQGISESARGAHPALALPEGRILDVGDTPKLRAAARLAGRSRRWIEERALLAGPRRRRRFYVILEIGLGGGESCFRGCVSNAVARHDDWRLDRSPTIYTVLRDSYQTRLVKRGWTPRRAAYVASARPQRIVSVRALSACPHALERARARGARRIDGTRRLAVGSETRQTEPVAAGWTAPFAYGALFLRQGWRRVGIGYADIRVFRSRVEGHRVWRHGRWILVVETPTIDDLLAGRTSDRVDLGVRSSVGQRTRRRERSGLPRGHAYDDTAARRRCSRGLARLALLKFRGVVEGAVVAAPQSIVRLRDFRYYEARRSLYNVITDLLDDRAVRKRSADLRLDTLVHRAAVSLRRRALRALRYAGVRQTGRIHRLDRRQTPVLAIRLAPLASTETAQLCHFRSRVVPETVELQRLQPLAATHADELSVRLCDRRTRSTGRTQRCSAAAIRLETTYARPSRDQQRQRRRTMLRRPITLTRLAGPRASPR